MKRKLKVSEELNTNITCLERRRRNKFRLRDLPVVPSASLVQFPEHVGHLALCLQLLVLSIEEQC